MIKNIKFILLVLALSFVLPLGVNAQKQNGKKNDKETVVFDVSMTCGNCKKRIEKNIAYEKGVTDMEVDLPTKTVKVTFKKDKTTVEKLQAAIEDLGYTATIHNEVNKKEEI